MRPRLGKNKFELLLGLEIENNSPVGVRELMRDFDIVVQRAYDVFIFKYPSIGALGYFTKTVFRNGLLELIAKCQLSVVRVVLNDLQDDAWLDLSGQVAILSVNHFCHFQIDGLGY